MKCRYFALLACSISFYAAHAQLEHILPHRKLDLGGGFQVFLEHPRNYYYTLSITQPGGQDRLLWDTARDRRPGDEELLFFSGIEAGIKANNLVTVLIGAHASLMKLVQFDLMSDPPFIRADYPGTIFSGFEDETEFSRFGDSPVRAVFDTPTAFRIESKDRSILELPPLQFEIDQSGQFLFNGRMYDPITTNFLNIYSSLLKRPLSNRWADRFKASAQQLPPASPQPRADSVPAVKGSTGQPPEKILASALESRTPERTVGIVELTAPRVLCLICLVLLLAMLLARRFRKQGISQ